MKDGEMDPTDIFGGKLDGLSDFRGLSSFTVFELLYNSVNYRSLIAMQIILVHPCANEFSQVEVQLTSLLPPM